MSQAPDYEVKRFIYDELDLRAVVRAARETHGWTVPESEVAERRYRDFLWACWNNINNRVPGIGSFRRFAAFSRSADEVWHQHILWTEKYREDCARVFEGRYLDHVPVYAAEVSPADMAAAMEVYRRLELTEPPDMIHECVWATVG